MRQTLDVNSGVVNKQKYGGFEKNSFDKIGCRITHSHGDLNAGMCVSEVEVAGVDVLHDCGCVSNPPPNVDMYSASCFNFTPMPYEQDTVLSGASSYRYCQQPNHEGKSNAL